MKVKHYLAAAVLLLTMATAAQAADDKPMVSYTTADGTPHDPIDFTNLIDVTSTGMLVDAVTLTATGTWTYNQLNGLCYALRPTGGNTNTENATLVTADLSGAVCSGSTICNMSGLFRSCTALTTVTLPAGGTDIVTYFSNLFYHCKALKSVTNLDKFTNVSSFYNAFNGCEALQGVTLPEGSSADDTDFSSAFSGCKALKGITNLDKFAKASDFASTFRDCEALTDVTLPVPADATKSFSFQYTFSGCTALERITNLEAYTNVSNLYSAFSQCHNLLYVKLGSVPGSNTMSTFYYTNSNCLKYLSKDVTAYPNDWTNVIVDGKATADIYLYDTFSGRICPFYCPEPFNMDGHTMTYNRVWTYATQQGGWNTLCLPFAAATAQKELVSGAWQDITPAATGKDGAYLLKTLAASPDAGEIVLANAATVEAYKPSLVALPGSSFGTAASLENRLVRFVSATDATIGKTPDLSAQQPLAGSQYTMYGTLQDYQADNLYLLYNEKTGDAVTASSFELYEDGGGVHPFRAYIKANNANALSAPRLVIKGGGGTTGIREASVGASSTEVPAVSYVYSIDGRLLRTVSASEYGQRLDGLDRGIYIVNGVKEVVR